MPERPRRGRFFAATAAGFFWREVRRPGSALRPPPRLGARYRAKLGIWRAGTPSASRKGLRDLNAGQNSPANHPASTFVLPSASPPRRGFRGSAEPRCLTPALGRCGTLQHSPPHTFPRCHVSSSLSSSHLFKNPGNVRGPQALSLASQAQIPAEFTRTFCA